MTDDEVLDREASESEEGATEREPLDVFMRRMKGDGMTLNAYQREASRTRGDAPDMMALSRAGMGLAGEAGEVVDLIKKVIHHGVRFDEKVRAKLIIEGGDVLWYLSDLATALGVTLDEMARMNVAKLRVRYPDGFTTADSVARRDEKVTT